MAGESARGAGREEYDRSLLRLYGELGRAYTYRAVVDALRSEIEQMLGYGSIWLQIVREDTDDLLTLDSGGPVLEIMHTLLQDERFRTTLHGEEFVVVPIGDDPWLHEILSFGDVHVTEDARTHPLTNKDMIALTRQRSVVCVPLRLAEKTLGYLNMGTFDDEVRVPDEAGLDFLRSLSNHVAVALDRVRFLGERAKVQRSLERLVEELRFSSFLLDNVMDGIIVRDAADGRVLYLNDAMCRLAGMERHEITELPEGGWVSEGQVESLQRHLADVRKTGWGDMEATAATAGQVPLEIRSSLIEYRGNRAILSLVSDISERKAAQASAG